jgi:hypothetical protein
MLGTRQPQLWRLLARYREAIHAQPELAPTAKAKREYRRSKRT